ncbi:MAG TPA: peptide ABC transporter substrate-binding protein [Acidimicrobiia bacterium]
MKRWRWVSLVAVLALVVASCGGDDGAEDTTTTPPGESTTTSSEPGTTAEPGTTTEAPPTGGVAGEGGLLALLQWQAPSTLNPFLSGGTKELLAASLILEPLAEFSPEGELVASLAAEIPTVENGGVSEDLTSVTWTLKEGVTWSDGTPLTADDVVFTWEYCTQTSDCTQSTFFAGITAVEAVDPVTALVTFDSPQPFPYNAFVTYQSPILQKAQFENCVGANAAQCTDENFSPVGTGPFTVTEFLTNDTASYALNPNYRGIADGKPFFGEVLIKGGGDAEAAARSVLELGEADYAWNLQVDPVVLANMEAAGLGVVDAGFASNVERIDINQTNADPDLGADRSEYLDGANPHPFLTDPAVVNAMSMAIDRQVIVDVAYGDGGLSTCNLWPIETETGGQSTNNDACLVQDIEGAIALLEGAGYVDSDGDGIRETPDGDPLFVLYQTSTNAVRQTTQDLVKDWWSQIGIDAELKNVVADVYFGGDPASPDTYQKFYADVEMYTNGSGSPDPQTYLGNYVTDQIVTADNFGGSNIPRWSRPEFDALYAELQGTTDFAQRKELSIQLNDMIVQGGAIIPLTWRGSVSAFANTLQGYGTVNGWDSEYWNVEDWVRS